MSEKITCDGCRCDLSVTTNFGIQRIKVVVEHVPLGKENSTTLMYYSDLLPNWPLHFCGVICMRSFLKKEFGDD